MKNNNKSGRISVKNRQALVAPVAEFAQAHNLPANLVMSSVLWAGERLQSRMTFKALKGLINEGTIETYRTELARRSAAHDTQIIGMVRNALPKPARTDANVSTIIAQIRSATAAAERNLSTVELKEVIQSFVGTATV